MSGFEAEEFNRALSAWAVENIDSLEAKLRALMIDLAERIIDRTPVKTGHAKANWQGSINTVVTEELEGFDPSGEVTKSSMMQVFQSFELGQTMYLQNNVPYINRLEYGWSQQAPEGMVRLTLIEMTEELVRSLSAK